MSDAGSGLIHDFIVSFPAQSPAGAVAVFRAYSRNKAPHEFMRMCATCRPCGRRRVLWRVCRFAPWDGGYWLAWRSHQRVSDGSGEISQRGFAVCAGAALISAHLSAVGMLAAYCCRAAIGGSGRLLLIRACRAAIRLPVAARAYAGFEAGRRKRLRCAAAQLRWQVGYRALAIGVMFGAVDSTWRITRLRCRAQDG